MIILYLMQIAIAFFAVLFFVSQIAIPLLYGTKMFPFFRKNRSILRKSLVENNEEIEVEKIRLEEIKLQQKLKNLKKENQNYSNTGESTNE